MHFILIAGLLAFLTFLNILAPVSGSATVTPLLAGLVGAKDAIAVATLFFLLTCIPRVYLFRSYIRWDIVKILWPVSVVGAIIGSFVFTQVNAIVISFIILGFLLWFLYQKITALSQKNKQEKKPTKRGVIFVGLLSGGLQSTGLAGSDLRNSYLLSKGLSISNLHGTTALIGGSTFLFACIVRAYTGQLTLEMATPILALFPVIVIATYIGRHITLKLPKKWQDRLALFVMTVALFTLITTLVNELVAK